MGVELSEVVGERGHDDVDLAADRVDRLVQVVEVGQELAHQEGVLGTEAASERLAQGRQLLAQLTPCELGQDRRIGRARQEGVEHRAAGGAEQARGDRGELDARILQDLVQAVGVAGAFLNEDTLR